MSVLGFILAGAGLSVVEELIPDECPEKYMVRGLNYGCLIAGSMIAIKSLIVAIKSVR